VPPQPQPRDREEEDRLAIWRPASPVDQCRRVTVPRRPLPEERGEEDEGAVGGEIWQDPASLEAQRDFYLALLDEIDRYTEVTEIYQSALRSLGSAQQPRVESEIRKRAQELQDQLEWAEKSLHPKAISESKLECAF